jgi:hypothetical protein
VIGVGAADYAAADYDRISAVALAVILIVIGCVCRDVSDHSFQVDARQQREKQRIQIVLRTES